MIPKSALGSRPAGVVLLGGTGMTAAAQEPDGSTGGVSVERALALLEEALQILDALGDCPEVGARLQHIIEALEERRAK